MFFSPEVFSTFWCLFDKLCNRDGRREGICASIAYLVPLKFNYFDNISFDCGMKHLDFPPIFEPSSFFCSPCSSTVSESCLRASSFLGKVHSFNCLFCLFSLSLSLTHTRTRLHILSLWRKTVFLSTFCSGHSRRAIETSFLSNDIYGGMRVHFALLP